MFRPNPAFSEPIYWNSAVPLMEAWAKHVLGK
ncbi:hypothetical protein AWB75_03482 [Caballeronia catudaia]|uniref:Uncharacterized protein n=1 Tax=Caballeronia catudaia TaxID=1777136 RepID=A0A158BGZ9_9BURK|nr:hypothetical protein AWB75_03482 [Caballeronia catudaia]